MKASVQLEPEKNTQPVSDLIKKGLIWAAANTSGGQEEAQKNGNQDKDHLEAFLEIFAAGTTHELFYHEKKKEKVGKKKDACLPLCSLPAFLAVNAWKKNASTQVIWVGKESYPAPFLLEQLAGNEEEKTRLINAAVFTDPPDRKLSLWTFETSLRSKGVSAVVGRMDRLSFTLSRRMALAAEEGGTLGFFIRSWKDRNTPSASVSRWCISPLPTQKGTPSFELELLRCKGKQPPVTLWTLEMATDDEEAISMHVFPMVVERTLEKVARKAA